MEDLIKLRNAEVQVLRSELAKLKEELAEAKELMKEIINAIEVESEQV